MYDSASVKTSRIDSGGRGKKSAWECRVCVCVRARARVAAIAERNENR